VPEAAQLACYWLSNRTQSPLGLLPKGKTTSWCFQSQVVYLFSPRSTKIGSRENETPTIVETINFFKEYWANGIALANQTAAPVSQHGYGMAAMDDDASIASYSESLANFGAAYTDTQESMKAQATTMATMQGQLTNIQQLCMAVGQQPPPNIYTPSQ